VAQRGANIFYVPFAERPKHLDPVQAYSENEYLLIGSIYTPPLQYHYLKRPYELIPSAATEMPRVTYYDAADKALPENADAKSIAYSVYEIHLKPGFKYQPHPAFATDAQGKPAYASLKREDLSAIFELRDFKQTGTREVTAQDFVYQIKRLAHPRLHSPIFGLMAEHIVGLPEYAEKVKAASKDTPRDGYIDLNQFDVSGVSAVDASTYRIKVKGKYAQFVYWLAMPFFAPIPVEVDRFYAQPSMADKNLSLDWYPVGAGPYMLTVNNPNRQMVLERNPNFPGEVYPSEGEAGDAEAGLLKDAGQRIPFIDKVIFSLDKEQIPIWNKFLQGYYDVSGITVRQLRPGGTDVRDGEPRLSEEMERQGIRLQTSVGTSVSYMGFNMLDPVVGTRATIRNPRASCVWPSRLRLDQEENISIFRNGRASRHRGRFRPASSASSKARAGINRYVYDWVGGEPRRKPLEAAKKLLAEAGYPDGHRQQEGHTLIVYFDSTLAGAGAKATSDWLIKQFRQDQSAARRTQHRLQSFPGEDAQRHRAALLLGLERRLSRPGEFPVSVPQQAGQGQIPGRERIQLRERGVRQAVRSHARHAERARAPGGDQRDAGDAAPRCALGVRLPSQGIRARASVDLQSQADQDGQQRDQVSEDRSGVARSPAHGMESPDCAPDRNRRIVLVLAILPAVIVYRGVSAPAR
jgi:ABC-type transport system substrate-binding protein